MLTDNNIEAELSYAYLHAVASRAGFGCKWGNRADDDAGVDAQIRVNGKLTQTECCTNFNVDVQLKATTKKPTEKEGILSYSLKVKNYDELRNTNVMLPSVLVVLFLPADKALWLVNDEEQLVSRRCAYWQVLYGASATSSKKEKTVYLPRSQHLTPESLSSLMTRISVGEVPTYGF